MNTSFFKKTFLLLILIGSIVNCFAELTVEIKKYSNISAKGLEGIKAEIFFLQMNISKYKTISIYHRDDNKKWH